jgi:tripartite-type tricarboxylate transporter receptor subunit TctC
MHRILQALALVLAAALLAPAESRAQAYPSRVVKVVVPYPPGGGVDFTARLIVQRLSASLGQPFIVENRPGAGGSIGEDFVSKSEPDGYTLAYAVGSDLASRKFFTRKPTLDPLKDFTPIATAVGSVNCIAVSGSHPAKSFRELVEMTRRSPGKLTYGTSGVQSYYYLIGELLRHNGMDMVHVPYKGNAPVAVALVGGEIDVALINLAPMVPHLTSGKARALAVIEAKRYPGAPDIPTVSETLPDFKAPPSWFGFFGPPGLAQPIVEKLNAEVAAALESPGVRGKINGIQLNVIVTPAAQMRPLIVETAESFRKVVESAKIQPYD